MTSQTGEVVEEGLKEEVFQSEMVLMEEVFQSEMVLMEVVYHPGILKIDSSQSVWGQGWMED